MALFRGTNQRDKVIAALVGDRDLVDQMKLSRERMIKKLPLGTISKPLFRIAYELLHYNQVMIDLDAIGPDDMSKIGSLMVSLGNGFDDIDEWLSIYGE